MSHGNLFYVFAMFSVRDVNDIQSLS